ncbi:transcription antiterminator, PTS operon regulator domain protein [Clostridioides difficile CD88]|nr:transcription antiterminator, PTS operon regulator domain protein [Clostridioides difficile CD46]EQG40588.1 transcription antiterminator, PTS operon regulator domain protein [Clostridioides difficile DA00128]EQJ04905.1 transcription antiterminator, PTS operon regulator domain protein [Clostridioides difficile P6]EQL11341.1 transcription antiterminator, PTS operon regulator domain protein [Clostridioides difficile CD88]
MIANILMNGYLLFVMLISKENLILGLNLVEMEQTKYW